MNGHVTETFLPSRGIRQCCPISALLFILTIEVLSNKIRSDDCIKRIYVGKPSNAIKLWQLADDMTLFIQNSISGTKALEYIEDFGDYSGVVLNKDKTRAMWLEEGTPVETICGIPWADNYVKALGIVFSKKNLSEF